MRHRPLARLADVEARGSARAQNSERARLHTPSMLASWTRAAGAAVHERLSPEQRAGLARERMPYALALQVWQCCEDSTPESFGLAFVQRVQLADLGVAGYLAASSEDVLSALRRAVRYHQLFKDPSQVELVEEHAGVRLIERPPPGFRWPAALCEAVLGGYIEFLRRFSDTRLVPQEVRFQHGARPWSPLHRAYFGDHVHFDQPSNSLLLAREDTLRPLSTRDATLLQLLLPAAEGQLAALQAEDALLSRVAHAIASALPDGYPELSRSARQLAMSERSLQRQLAARGVRYQDLVDDVRRERATRLLRESGRSIDEVAFLVGFSDASGLRRAFRRWTGASPQALRRASPGAGSSSHAG